jgi:hypothetical protein
VLPVPPHTLWASAADGSIAVPANAVSARKLSRAPGRTKNALFQVINYRRKNTAAPLSLRTNCKALILQQIA